MWAGDGKRVFGWVALAILAAPSAWGNEKCAGWLTRALALKRKSAPSVLVSGSPLPAKVREATRREVPDRSRLRRYHGTYSREFVDPAGHRFLLTGFIRFEGRVAEIYQSQFLSFAGRHPLENAEVGVGTLRQWKAQLVAEFRGLALEYVILSGYRVTGARKDSDPRLMKIILPL